MLQDVNVITTEHSAYQRQVNVTVRQKESLEITVKNVMHKITIMVILQIMVPAFVSLIFHVVSFWSGIQ